MVLNIFKKLGLFLVKLGLLVGGFYLVIALFFGTVWFSGSNMKEKKVSGVKERVEIILDESEESYVNRVGKLLNSKDDANYKLTDHKIKFDRSKGSILVRVADSSLEFKYPHSLMVTTNWREKERRVNSFYMTLALTSQGRIQNSEARSHIYQLIKSFQDVGWKRSISLSSARIVGNEVYKYNNDSNFYTSLSLDDKYILTNEEWISLTSYDWKFYYKDKGYLSLKVMREQKGKKIDDDEGYFLLIQFDTIGLAHGIDLTNEYEKNTYLEKQKHWKNLRVKSEEKAINLGYHIDYEYEDSPLNRGIFDLSKHHNEHDENVTCTKTGYWQSYLPSEVAPHVTPREGEIFFYEKLNVFLEKSKPLHDYHEHLRWRYLGSQEEYELIEGKLVKKVKDEEGKSVAFIETGKSCPKSGYWKLGIEKETFAVSYFKKGMTLESNQNDPLALLAKWQYLGDEKEFMVQNGYLVRRG